MSRKVCKFNRSCLLWIMSVAGGLSGWLYYNYIGCLSGTCPIKSNPYLMTGYGLVLGFLIGYLFIPERKKK